MSRLGKIPINIPKGVAVKIEPGLVVVKGPKGELNQAVPHEAIMEVVGDQLIVKVKNSEISRQKAYWGLTRQLLANAVAGVTVGFTKQLEIQGVGYRAQIDGKNLILNVGFSHPVNFSVPEGISIKVEKNLITVTGISKQLVGEITANIRAIKPPEPYKGKGIKYSDEVVRRKAGKLAKAASGPK
ncbi:MAG: 50S ribosomal protein L6 [Patescibacteria group bacterium]